MFPRHKVTGVTGLPTLLALHRIVQSGIPADKADFRTGIWFDYSNDVRMVFSAFSCLVMMATIGCVSSAPKIVGAPADWIGRQGGACGNGASQRRVDRLARELCSVSGCSTPLQVRILNSDELAAFAWPCNQIFVTRALVDSCGDDELSAALAHEMGHLLNDGHLPNRSAFSLGGRGEEIEMSADEVAVQLLRAAHRHPDALVKLLERLERSPQHCSGTSVLISRRISMLRDAS